MPSFLPVNCSTAELYRRTLDILERLVGFDTTSHKPNLELVQYVQSLLAGNGIDSRLYFNADRNKANLVATAGRQGQDRLGIVWSGHTDVVPVDGQVWTSDPFRLRVTDDRATGRGSADMKGFIACCLALLSAVDQDSLSTPVTLLLTYDEEVGCVGARHMVEELRGRSGSAVGCVVGEPTGMKPVIGHKGKQNHRVRVTGEPKHAALAPGLANPIAAAAELVAFAQSMNERFQSSGPHDGRFEIDHSWINVGRIDGGVKPNIVPETCVVDLEIRNVPGHSCDEMADELRRFALDEVLGKMLKKTPSASVLMERLSDTPSFAIDASHPFVRLVGAVSGEREAGEFVPFGTEAGLIWGHAGIPAVVWGPGSISEAHTADESVPLEQLRLCLAQLRSLLLA